MTKEPLICVVCGRTGESMLEHAQDDRECLYNLPLFIPLSLEEMEADCS